MRGRCWFSYCIRGIIPTKSILRVELEQKTYADNKMVRDPTLIFQKGFRVFKSCSKGHLPFLNVNCYGTMPSRSFWMVLEKVRIRFWTIEIGD